MYTLGHIVLVKEIAPGIISDPEILNGKPVLKHTRIPVSFILANLEDMSIESIAEDLEISVEQIKDAIRYASKVTKAA